jgi:hypothetical protein
MTGSTVDTGQEGSDQLAESGHDLKRLDPFVGTWRIEGRQYEGPLGHAANVNAEETFEWLPGGQFLIHRLRGRLGEAEMACVEIIEGDPAIGDYPVHTFYGDGRSRDFRLSEHDREWILDTARTNSEAPDRLVRCIQRFENGGKTRSARWDSSADGVVWQTFWDVTATKKGFDRAEPEFP